VPFKSQAQRRFMYSQHPKIAQRWEKETPKGKLPDKKESENMPEMKKVFEKKGEKHDGPGTPSKVDCVPNPCWNDEYKDNNVKDDMTETLDMASLRDPAKFVAGVEKFIGDVKKDAGQIQHFAGTYKQSVKLDDTQKAAFGKLDFPLKMINKFADELGRLAGEASKSGAGAAPQGQANQPPAQGQQAQAQKKPGFLNRVFGKKAS
jgi:hypothetical protein